MIRILLRPSGERLSIGPRGNGLALVNGQVIPNPFPGTGSPVLDFRFVPTYVNQQLVSPLFPTIQNGVLQSWGGGTELSIRGIEVLKQVQVLPIFQQDSTVPYTAHVTGGIQKEIARDTVLQADFVMRRAVHFGGYHDLFPVR